MQNADSTQGVSREGKRRKRVFGTLGTQSLGVHTKKTKGRGETDPVWGLQQLTVQGGGWGQLGCYRSGREGPARHI